MILAVQDASQGLRGSRRGAGLQGKVWKLEKLRGRSTKSRPARAGVRT